MTLRCRSLSCGNFAPCVFTKAVWHGGLSPLIPSTATPRASIASTASPRPASSGVQMLPHA